MGELTAVQKRKVRKPLLWVGLASVVMTFAGLTSGYVVSRSALVAEGRWLEFELPTQFIWATVAIVVSSLTMIWAKQAAKRDNYATVKLALWITLCLGVAFAVLQFLGGRDLIDRGLHFVGGHTAISWVYVIAGLHWMHVMAGLIVLMVTLGRAHKEAYTSDDYLGLSMSAIFWHFLDGLWIYLFLFLVYFR